MMASPMLAISDASNNDTPAHATDHRVGRHTVFRHCHLEGCGARNRGHQSSVKPARAAYSRWPPNTATVLLACTITLGALCVAFRISLPPWSYSRRQAAFSKYLLNARVSVGGEGGGGALQASNRHLLKLNVSSDRDGGQEEGDAGNGGGGPLFADESPVEAVLADGESRCCVDSDTTAEDVVQRCLPTAFFIGVSKCGTTSLTDWMSHHPHTRWVPRPGYSYREAHVFDAMPEVWRSTSAVALRDRLAVPSEAGDTVLDYTPHYSLVAEAPFRIEDFYGNGYLRRHGLKFLVLLREPASRTISSWEYKSDPQMSAKLDKARNRKPMESWMASHAIETRPLKQAVDEGIEKATRLASCAANTTASGRFGHGYEVTSCEAVSREEAGAGGCEGAESCEVCKTHMEPWCNPRDYLESNLYDAHVGKSMYALQLSRWFAFFGRESFKVMFTEEMEADPLGVLEQAFQFLGLDLLDAQGQQGLRSREEWAGVVSVRRNEADPAKTSQLAPQVTPEVVQTLRDFFVPHNNALEELLGVPVPSSWQS